MSLSPVEMLLGTAEQKSAANYARRVTSTPEDAQLAAEKAKNAEPFDAAYRWYTTPCAPVVIVEERVEGDKTLQKVRQEYEGVVLEGWVGEPIQRSWGPNLCSHPRVMRTEDALGKQGGPGYLIIETEATENAVRRWMRSTGSLTRVEFDERDGPRCVTHTWSGGMARGAWISPEPGETRRVRNVERFDADGRLISIHQSGEWSDGTRGAQVRCYDSWEVVRVTDSAIEVVPGHDDSRKLLHWYHPEDVARWFLKPEDCEAALKERPNHSLKDPRLPSVSSRVAAMNVGSIGC